MTKFQLLRSLSSDTAKHKVFPLTIKGVTGIVESIQREDGSGSSFIVRLLDEFGKTTVVYIRTID